MAKFKSRIIDDYSSNIRNKKSLIGKEILLSEQGYCSNCNRNKYVIVIWGKDSYLDEPHIHMMDNQTNGNIINSAYSIVTGKPVKKHGSVINEILPNKVLSIINRMIKRIDCKSIINMWNLENGDNCKIKTFPKLSNY